MPSQEVEIAISGNNEELLKILVDGLFHPEIKFVKTNKDTKYKIIFIDLSKDLLLISQNVINTYKQCQDQNVKLAVILIHKSEIDIEKNHYFQKMFDDIGKIKPIHRLIFSKDVYQLDSEAAITSYDEWLAKSICENRINISQKGENITYPLYIGDLIYAIIKTLFLSNTSGNVYWVLGDPISDLEFSYLLKKNVQDVNNEPLEINAEEKNDPKANTLQNYGNKTRSELNWNPEKEITDDIKQIVSLYSNNQQPKEIKKTKENILYKIINWLYKPRPKNKQNLPTIRKIIKKITLVLIIWILAILSLTTVSTYVALQQLEKSTKQALEGNIKLSVTSLETSRRYKEVGESLITTLTPLINVVAPKGMEKIFNSYSFINYATTSLINLHQTYIIAENILLSLNSQNDELNYEDLSLGLRTNLSQIYENVNQISLLSNGNKIPSIIEKKLKRNSVFLNLKTLEEQITQYIKITEILPALISGENPRNIIILIQNSQNPDLAGGKIDYYLILTVSQGNLISKTFYTQAELEKLFVDNNPPIKKNNKPSINEELTLNEITKDPDYSISASNLAEYIEKSTKIKPDFVIAVNDVLIQEIILNESPKEHEQFMNNLISESGPKIQKDQIDQLIDRLFNHDITLPIIGRVGAKLIGESEILFWSSDNNLQRQIVSQSLSGVILNHPCNSSLTEGNQCISETSYLVESVDTTSRQSLWLDRVQKHEINILGDSIKHEYRLEYKPSSLQVSSSATQITYHLYSQSSNFDQLIQNDLPLSTKTVEKSTINGLDHYRFTATIPTDTDSVLVIKTTTQQGYSFSTPFTYSLTEYRQPGIKSKGVNLTIKYPEKLRPSVATSPFNLQVQQMNLTLPKHTSTFGFTLVTNSE